MRNVRLTIEYDGTAFHGWQWQPGLRTIQGELTRVLEMVLRSKVERLTASGRTDAGVHARAQVLNFLYDEALVGDLDLIRLAHSVSNLLRGELAVLQAEEVSLDFDARANAIAKQYSYHLIGRRAPAVLKRGRAWHISTPLNIEHMQREAAHLVGTHDFSSFRGSGCNAKTATREILESEFLVQGTDLYYRVVGRGFLKQMVRNIVGTLVGLGKGNLWTASILEILSAQDRRRAGVTAPPYGLYLDWVKY